MMSSLALLELYEKQVRTDPGRVLCMGESGASLTAGDLLRGARSTSRTLRQEGVGPGDIVLLKGVSGHSLIIGMLSVWTCDAVVLATESSDRIAASGEVMGLHPRAILSMGHEAAPQISAVTAVSSSRRGVMPPGLAVIKLTSGSTGLPRGIAVTADQLLADASRLIETMRIAPDDVNIAAIPLSHSYGLGNLVMPLIVQGSPLRITSPLPDPLVRSLSTDRPAVFPGVPYLFEMLLRTGEERDGGLRRRGLKTCISAGAPLRASTAAQFEERFGIPVRAFYGTSETGGISYDASPDGGAARQGDGCVGSPLPGVEVTLGKDSRVIVTSSAVAAGYLGARGVEETIGDGGSFEGSRFRTADRGKIDPQGRLCLTGRTGAFVNVSGRKVDPREVEDLLTSLEGVSAAAVLGDHDETRGQALVAYLVAKGPVTRELVMRHLRRHLAAYKLPRRVFFLNDLPVTARGKLDTEMLRRRIRGAEQGPVSN